MSQLLFLILGRKKLTRQHDNIRNLFFLILQNYMYREKFQTKIVVFYTRELSNWKYLLWRHSNFFCISGKSSCSILYKRVRVNQLERSLSVSFYVGRGIVPTITNYTCVWNKLIIILTFWNYSVYYKTGVVLFRFPSLIDVIQSALLLDLIIN